MFADMFPLAILAAAGLQYIYNQATTPSFPYDIEEMLAELRELHLEMQITGPYKRRLFDEHFDTINTPNPQSSYCPNTNIIELVALHRGYIYENCENPEFVTPETWSTVTSTRIANNKAPLSIGQVYSNSVFGIHNVCTGPSTTPNRAPLHLVAVYTRHIGDTCINPAWPPSPSTTATTPTKTVVSIVFEKVTGILASYIHK